jgi:hypothetical protein
LVGWDFEEEAGTMKAVRLKEAPLDEHNSWRETLYLLRSPANAEHLRRSIAEAQAGLAQERKLHDV